MGSAASGTSTTRYYLSLGTKKRSIDPRLTGTRDALALGVGEQSTDTVTVTIPATVAPGSYYLLACGDDLRTVAEGNEGNNCKASATRISVGG
jgi:CARDB protein